MKESNKKKKRRKAERNEWMTKQTNEITKDACRMSQLGGLGCLKPVHNLLSSPLSHE